MCLVAKVGTGLGDRCSSVIEMATFLVRVPLAGAGVSIGRTVKDFDLTFSSSI